MSSQGVRVTSVLRSGCRFNFKVPFNLLSCFFTVAHCYSRCIYPLHRKRKTANPSIANMVDCDNTDNAEFDADIAGLGVSKLLEAKFLTLMRYRSL